MAHFRIVFADGQTTEYPDVSQLTYVSAHAKGSVTVSENLEEHCVPVGYPLWLRTSNGIVGVNGEGIRLIEVTAD